MQLRSTGLGSLAALPDMTSVVRDQVGPSYAQVRPFKSIRTDAFPAIPGLLDTMADPRIEHPNPEIARALATAAGYAYSDVGTVAMMMTRLGLESSICREVSRSVDAMLIRSTAHLVQSADGKVVVLCYRGTPPLDLIGWLLDADVAPERIALTAESQQTFEVHAGFYRNVRVTRPEVVAALQGALLGHPVTAGATDGTYARFADERIDALPEGLEAMEAFYITGHSLGGAMAVIMARMLLMSSNKAYQDIARKLRAVYTFGQPMVATPKSAADSELLFTEKNVPLLRYVYKKDPVPALPPHDAGDYEHFGEEFRYDEKNGYAASKTTEQIRGVPEILSAALPFALDKLPALRWLPWPYDLEDHLPHHYVSSLIPDGQPDEFGDYTVERLPRH
jgi:hypothetical protein